MGVDDPDHQILMLALRRMRAKLVKEIDEVAAGGSTDLAIAAAITSAIVNVEAIAAIETHSKALVRLTWALVGLTAILSIFTLALLVGTFA